MKIGFLDYQLTHSHYKKYFPLLTGAGAAGEFVVAAANELTPSDQGRKWCADNNVRYCESAAEVVSSCDAILAFAPNNPEKHLELTGPALASGKPLFVDKLLADTPAHAEAMVAATKKANTPLMCASAVRFALELEDLDKRLKGTPEGIFARGYGKFPVYGVHTITMAIKYYGTQVGRVIDTGDQTVRLITIDTGGRKASIEVRDTKTGAKTTPWQLGVISEGAYEVATITNVDGFYANLVRKMADFFKTGKSPISAEEQLAAVQVQYAADQSLTKGGVWVDVKAS